MSKSALVTGASQGLGLCFCKELLSRGYHVIALDLRLSDELSELVSSHLQFINCDVTSTEAVKKAGNEVSIDSLDVIINNAGVWIEKRRKLDDPDFELEYEAMHKMFEINALGVLRIVREFIPKLLKGNMKKVLNIASEAASIGECWRKSEYGYCMSKVAQNMATKIMSNYYEDNGVKFYAVHPGWMMTPQGFAGVNSDALPYQRPEDSAKIFIDLVEDENKEGIYFDVTGREMQW